MKILSVWSVYPVVIRGSSFLLNTFLQYNNTTHQSCKISIILMTFFEKKKEFSEISKRHLKKSQATFSVIRVVFSTFSRIHYEFSVFCANAIWLNYQFANWLWIHFLSCEFTKNSLFFLNSLWIFYVLRKFTIFSRIDYVLTIFSQIDY